jgi:DNA primase
MGLIPDSQIREILDRTDILAVVGEHVRLTKRGNRWVGLCPFHGEKTPSFHVDPGKGLFYCFGCQKGGSVVQFLMELEKSTFREVMENLASRVGITIAREASESGQESDKERRALEELNEKLANTFHWLLLNHPSANLALERLRSRGLPEEIIQGFRLGYSLPDRSWLSQFLTSKGYSENFLQRSGFFSTKTPGYPLFSGRLMFPIVDAKGRVIAFGGRILEGEGPKYINSPDTLLFKKQDSLFALDHAQAAVKKENSVIVCEGYMDALSFHAAGIRNAVAPLGTAFTFSQAKLLRRWAETVIFCFDADDAGRKATERACSVAAMAGLRIFVVRLPGGKDASEILEKEGPETLQKTASFAINGDDFLIERARELFDIGTVEGKVKAAAFLYPYVDALDSEVRRFSFLEYAARTLGANPESIRGDYESARRRADQRSDRIRYTETASGEILGDRLGSGSGSIARTPDLVFAVALTLNPDRYIDIRSRITVDDLDDFRARDLLIALEEAFRADDLRIDSVVRRADDETAKRFVHEAAASGEFDMNPDRLIEDGAWAIKRRSLMRRRERILTAIAGLGGGNPDASSSLNDLLYEKMNLDAELESMKGERDERP